MPVNQKAFLAIDQGTTSSRAIVFDNTFQIAGVGQFSFDQHFPNDAWVEHDPEAIWQTSFDSIRQALVESKRSASDITAIGITNQRETTFIWDKQTGECIYPAIVWQDRRTTSFCEQLKGAGHESKVQSKTGLLLDPYFSATKIHWILNHVEGARERANQGELLFGTVDTFLIWRLTEGRVHATDASNASRTLLFDIHKQAWDEDLLSLFGIPKSMLPEVKDSASDFGETTLFGSSIPISGVAGDQSAALIGQTCFDPGMLKCTFGTGAFLMMNTGNQAISSSHNLLSTTAYRLNGQVTYALEGSVFVAGAVIKWLNEKLGLISEPAEAETFSKSVDGNLGVYFVPALTGLGAPYWKPDVRGAIFGLTRDTDQRHIVRAAVEAVAYQAHDLLEAMKRDGANLSKLRVDGGMVHNQWFCQFLADILNVTVDVPHIVETTALGAAYLAAVGVGTFSDLSELNALWLRDKAFNPTMKKHDRKTCLSGWERAIQHLVN